MRDLIFSQLKWWFRSYSFLPSNFRVLVRILIPKMCNQNLPGTLFGMFIYCSKNSEIIYMHCRTEQVSRCVDVVGSQSYDHRRREMQLIGKDNIEIGGINTISYKWYHIINEHIYYLGLDFQISFPIKSNYDFLEKWLMLGLGKERHKMRLKSCFLRN